MNFYEMQMRTMFANKPVFQNPVFVDKTMLARLSDTLNVKLQFIATEFKGQYNTIQVSIINRNDGVIDKQNFKFSDIIGKYLRVDNLASPLDYHMWECKNPEWYTPISIAQKEKIGSKIAEYVSLFLTEEAAACG